MAQVTQFNGPVTSRNIISGVHLDHGSTMVNNFRGDDSDDLRVLDAFQGDVDYRLQKNRNQACAPETGNWFFEHELYRTFRETKEIHLLFVTAEAGGGKSTIMRTLADQLVESDGSPLVAYFFFKDDDSYLSSYSGALSSLVHQLLVQDQGLLPHVRKLCEKTGFSVKHNTKLMWDALAQIICNSQRDIYCLFDALDECKSTERPQLIADMKNFLQTLHSVDSRFKFVVSSRPYQDEDHPYDSLIAVEAKSILHLAGESAEVQPDIRRVICFKAEELAKERKLDPDIREMLISELSSHNRHTRSFLAVQVAFELLRSHRRMHSQAGRRTINMVLDDIPHRLDKQFDEMLNRSLDREHAMRLFCVILAARRTIELEEFKVIYCVTESSNPKYRPTSYDDLEIPIDDGEFKQLVRARCGLFITFVKNSVHLFHQTAREHLLGRFVTTPATAVDSTSWKNSVSLEQANLALAAVCLDILSFMVPEKIASDLIDDLKKFKDCLKVNLTEFSSDRPLFSYAALNWHKHASNAGEAMHELIGHTQYDPIFDISKPQFWMWFIKVAHVAINYGEVLTVENMAENYNDFAWYLRERCITKLHTMDQRVHALFCNGPLPTPQIEPTIRRVSWKASNGFELIDRFHIAVGMPAYTSFVRRVRAEEEGDAERVDLLGEIPLNIWIWTSIADGAPRALVKALSYAKDISWLHEVPDHIVHLHRWIHKSGSEGYYFEGHSYREEWERAYPLIFALMLKTSSLTSGELVFEALADWIDTQTLKREFAQQLWEAGGFIIPSLCRRLTSIGVSVDCIMWKHKGTALHYSAAFWAHDVVQCLLELGADATMRSVDNRNALHWLSYQDQLRFYPDILVFDYASMNPHHKTRVESSVKAIANSVRSKHKLLNEPDLKGWTPLLCAVRSLRSSPTTVKALLEEGAQVDQQDSRGRTALMHFFCTGFSQRSARMLRNILAAGADPMKLDANGSHAIYYYLRQLTLPKILDVYPGYNAFNRAFDALANHSSLSQQDLIEELGRSKVPLVVAAKLGNAQMCWYLLIAGASLNEHGLKVHRAMEEKLDIWFMHQNLDWHPLMVALQSKAYVTACLLLYKGADINFHTRVRGRTKHNKQDVLQDLRTPLHTAISGLAWDSPGLEMHIGKCVFHEARGFQNWVPTRLSPQLGEEEKNEDSSDDEEIPGVVREKTQHRGANRVPYDIVDNIETPFKTNKEPLINVVIDRNLSSSQRQEALIELMLKKGAAVNACTRGGVTPLGSCARMELPNIAKLLLKYGADPNTADMKGCTLLMIAADNGNHALVELLLQSRADPNAQLKVPSIKKCTCGDFFGHYICDAPFTALALAARNHHTSIVELLIEHGADPNLEITHHAHGKVSPTKKRRKEDQTPTWPQDWSDSDSSSESDSDLIWKGYITVGTALTWAKGDVRDMLLRHGALTTIEQPKRECDCVVEDGKVEEESSLHYGSDGSSEEYPSQGIPGNRTQYVYESSEDSFFQGE